MKKNNHKNDIVEKYRVLRNMLETLRKNDVKCLSVTSNSDIEGKAIIAKNLAMILARYGKKTLYIDSSLTNTARVKSVDSHKANLMADIHEAVYKAEGVMFSNTYINDIKLQSYIKDTQCENLSILSLGDYNLDNYSFMFKAEYLQAVVERLKKDFDHIIIDAPSFINLSYTQIVTSASDGCLFVLKEGINEINQGTAIKDKIATLGCKMLGCILNKEKNSIRIFDNGNDVFSNVEHSGRKSRANMRKRVNVEA